MLHSLTKLIFHVYGLYTLDSKRMSKDLERKSMSHRIFLFIPIVIIQKSSIRIVAIFTVEI